MKKLTIILLTLISLWTKAHDNPKLSRLQGTYIGLSSAVVTGIASHNLVKCESRFLNHTITLAISAAVPLAAGIILKNKDIVWGGCVGSFTLIVPLTFNPNKHRHEQYK